MSARYQRTIVLGFMLEMSIHNANDAVCSFQFMASIYMTIALFTIYVLASNLKRADNIGFIFFYGNSVHACG